MATLAGWMALGVVGTLTLSGEPGQYAQMSDAQVTESLRAAQSVADVGLRVQLVSGPFLGTPYVLGNMGEGPDGDGRDKDPRFNVQSADCTTFVEHAMAFALTASLEEARAKLDAIRYVRGRVDYGARRHWPEAQWVKGLVEEGFLEDVTVQLAGHDVRTAEAKVTLNADLFSRSVHATTMPLKPHEVPAGTFAVPYVGLADIHKVTGRLTPGLIVNVVKAPKQNLLVRISHQGLLVNNGGKFYVRHATSVGPRAVIDEALGEFVERQKKTTSWPTVGLQFLRIRTAPPPGLAP
jgi:hypothetical protein